MSVLPRISGREAVSAFRKLGYEVDRQKETEPLDGAMLCAGARCDVDRPQGLTDVGRRSAGQPWKLYAATDASIAVSAAYRTGILDQSEVPELLRGTLGLSGPRKAAKRRAREEA